MLWSEFEELYGARVRYDDYKNIIEPMYTATPDNVTKQQFVAMLDKKRFAIPTEKQYIKELKKRARDMFDKCGHVTIHDEEREFMEYARQFAADIYHIDKDDSDGYVLVINGYEYDNMRGCHYPQQLIIGRFARGFAVDREYARITLIEEKTKYGRG